MSVHDYSRTTGYEAAYEQYQQLQCYKGMKSKCGDFAEMISTGLPRSGLACSVHCGRIKLLRGYVYV